MKILRFRFEGLRLYENNAVSMDLYTTDRVAQNKAFTYAAINESSAVRTLTVIGIAGINASGKTTALRLADLALHIASGSALGSHINDFTPLIGIMQNELNATIIFEHKHAIYRLQSSLGSETAEPGIHTLFFRRESLQQFTGNRMSKKKLSKSIEAPAPDDWETRATRGISRPGKDKELSKDALEYLSPDRSIISAIIKNDAPTVTAELTPLLPTLVGNPAPQVFQLFDESIESLTTENNHFHLKFKNENEGHGLSPKTLINMVSSGTLRGAYLLSRALVVLQRGGYLLVDEIENSLNKQLVFAIMDLFASPATNPHGAVLLFTTHYPELLDHFSRKDNIWFAVRNEDGFSIVHLAQAITRTDLKKSMTFFANLVPGTAPSAEAVKALRAYAREASHAQE